jgi:hypothetical protein
MSFPVLQVNGWFPSNIPWAEHVGRQADHGPQGSFGTNGESHATMQIQVDFLDGPRALKDLLGTVGFNVASSSLQRTVPMTHPYWPYLYCTHVAYAPLRFDHKGIPDGAFTGFTVMANYDRWILTCGFTAPKFRVLSDTALQGLGGVPLQEYQRWVEWVPHTSTFELTREAGSSFKWADGPTPNTSFNSPVSQHLQQTELHAIWSTVPTNALFIEGTNFLNSNITGALNTLNDNTGGIDFFGRPKGTLLFKSAQPRVKTSWMHPDWQELAFGTRPDPNILWDVDMVFTYFDPSPYPDRATAAYFGHNLCPIPLDPKGRWALVTTTGAAGDAANGAGIYPYSNFANIFVPVNS